jgi:hypothetical protein
MIKRYVSAMDPGTGGGTPNTFFDADTNILDSATFDQHQANLVGVAAATLTIQVTTYFNNNSIGRVLVNGNEVFLNSTFPIILDGAGHGHFLARVEGNAGASNSVVRAVFTIVGMTAGFPSSPIAD